MDSCLLFGLYSGPFLNDSLWIGSLRSVWLSRAYPNVMVLGSDSLPFLLLLIGECHPSPPGPGGSLEERISGGRFPCLGLRLRRGMVFH